MQTIKYATEYNGERHEIVAHMYEDTRPDKEPAYCALSRARKWYDGRPGCHFFDRDTMRFFNSRLCASAWIGRDGVYFVTSERFGTEPRRYSVRVMRFPWVKDGYISAFLYGEFRPESSAFNPAVYTVGDYGEFTSSKAAQRAAKAAAAKSFA